MRSDLSPWPYINAVLKNESGLRWRDSWVWWISSSRGERMWVLQLVTVVNWHKKDGHGVCEVRWVRSIERLADGMNQRVDSRDKIVHIVTRTMLGGRERVTRDEDRVLWGGRTKTRLRWYERLKPNSITLASLELAPNMFGASSELVRSWNLAYHLAC